jgi:hypothetical protein
MGENEKKLLKWMKNSRSLNTAVSVSLLFHPVYGFFFTLIKGPEKPRKRKNL